MEFNRNVVLITGAASGIGRSCAEKLIAGGASVVLLDRREPALVDLASVLKGLGGDVMAIPADVTHGVQVRNAVRQVLAQYGRLDAAINVAGIEGPVASLPEQDDGASDEVLRVNVKGTFLCMKYELRAMLAAGNGAIVNAASIYGLAGQPRFSLYAASKHAVVGLTRAAALEVARVGVRVNAVAPGPILTPLLQRATSGNLTLVSNNIPMRRLGTPEEVAEAALWLCSNRAKFVTGHILSVDGGMAAQTTTLPDDLTIWQGPTEEELDG
jgi:NAD(P)-dependent dehydrogenase (short-subunit alcohol dehydrogenase family)